MHTFLKPLALLALASLQLTACAQKKDPSTSKTFEQMNNTHATETGHHTEVATFAAGCFWCTEAQFQQLEGVEKVESGFCGGHTNNPTYHDVCTGTTGHAEVCNIYYDPSKITYDELLAAFWTSHDPTQLNQQGNDVGTQYRSAIFYHTPEQKQKAEEYKKKINNEHVYDKPVVTTLEPFTVFYKAENYHQDYYNENGEQPYCKFVIQPKVEKFQKILRLN